MQDFASDRAAVRGRRRVNEIFLCLLGILLTTCRVPTGLEAKSTRDASTRAKPQTILQGKISNPQSSSGRLDRLVVMVIDGLRWQEVFNGPELDRIRSATERVEFDGPNGEIFPNLLRIARERGFLIGHDEAPIRISSKSTVSLPSYSELFSGRQPSCSNNDCPATRENTFLDDWLAQKEGGKLALISSWSVIPRIAARHVNRLFVSAGRDHNARFASWFDDQRIHRVYRLGRNADPKPGCDDYRPDNYTAELALAVLQAETPDFLFLGLGDTDEYAHQNRYHDYLKAIRRADDTIGKIDEWLQFRESRGERTLFVVTTDHGRSLNFVDHGGHVEASSIWALMAGSVVKLRGTPSFPPKTLSDLAPTFRSLLELNPDRSVTAGRDLMPNIVDEKRRPVMWGSNKAVVGNSLRSRVVGPG